MSELQIFKNAEFGSVRTIAIDGEPYFVGKDVADILGYANPRKAIIDHVDEEDKTDGVTIRDSIGREQNPVCINESGLYSLILSSKLPTAKKFKRWVTSEVLPSIRKYGEYKLRNEIENLKIRNDELQRQIKYVYTEDEINKKNEINYLVRKNFNGNIIGAYINLYKLFEDTYGINLKAECDNYNEDKEKRLKVNIIQYCLMTGHINQLYECCKMLYN